MPRSRERKLNRLSGFDYSDFGYYFVTICTQDQELHFSDVKNYKMILHEFGVIVQKQWLWLCTRYPYVKLDEFIVMPNHLHGIIIINDNNVGTGRDLSLQKNKIKSLSELIGAFKTTSSKKIHENHRIGLPRFQWQRSFYDRIIRNNHELCRIRNYIKNNPINWGRDRNNPNKL